MTEIIPAIIPQNLNLVRDRMSKVLGLVKKVQIDIMDGNYTTTKTWPFNGNQFEEIRQIVSGEENFPYIDDFILEFFLPEADFIQFMGNDRVGHSGVDLDKYVLEKIKNFHKRHPSIEIQIDIGVAEETIPKLKDAGVDYFVSGSSIFNTNNPKEAIMKLQNF